MLGQKYFVRTGHQIVQILEAKDFCFYLFLLVLIVNLELLIPYVYDIFFYFLDPLVDKKKNTKDGNNYLKRYKLVRKHKRKWTSVLPEHVKKKRLWCICH